MPLQKSETPVVIVTNDSDLEKAQKDNLKYVLKDHLIVNHTTIPRKTIHHRNESINLEASSLLSSFLVWKALCSLQREKSDQKSSSAVNSASFNLARCG